MRRSARVDLILELAYPDHHEICRFLKLYYDIKDEQEEKILSIANDIMSFEKNITLSRVRELVSPHDTLDQFVKNFNKTV